MARSYTTAEVWEQHRDEIMAMVAEAAAADRRVQRYFGGDGGRFFGAAFRLRGEKEVLFEWLGPGESQGRVRVHPNQLASPAQ